MPLVKVTLFVELADLRRAFGYPVPSGRRQHILKRDKVHVVRAKNPFKAGTKQHQWGEAVLKSDGKTVAACRKAGASRWAVREMVKRKVIRIDRSGRAGQP
jgi:hypothetical protein